MKGFCTWAANHISSSFYATVDQYVPTPIQQIAKNILIQTKAVFDCVISPFPRIAISDSPQTRNSFKHAFCANVIFYAIPLAFYQSAIRQLPEDDESSILYSIGYMTILFAGTALRLRELIRLKNEK